MNILEDIEVSVNPLASVLATYWDFPPKERY
jgi:hypothetical protein